jgi:hypothetical protein
MSFKLTKQEDAQRAKLQVALSDARAILDAKIEDVNDALQTAVDALEGAITDYNSALDDARNFVVDIVSQAEEDFSDKSERWQEGERGEIVRAWIDEWDNAQLDDIDAPEIERIAIDADDHADILDQLPSEAE